METNNNGNEEKNENEIQNAVEETDNQKKEVKDEEKADIICRVSQILFFGPLILWWLSDALLFIPILPMKILYNIVHQSNRVLSVCPLIGFILMIYVRIKYPNNERSKTLRNAYIAIVITYLVIGIKLFITCYSMLKDCNLPG